jgi:hypothetical protein
MIELLREFSTKLVKQEEYLGKLLDNLFVFLHLCFYDNVRVPLQSNIQFQSHFIKYVVT